MVKKIPGSVLSLYSFLITGSILLSTANVFCETFISNSDRILMHPEIQISLNKSSDEIGQLNNSLQALLSKNLLESSKELVDSLFKKIAADEIKDSKILSESYYLIGVYYFIEKKYIESIKFLNLSIELKEKNKEYDERFAKALYNISIAFNALGDFNSHEDFSLRSLELEKKIFGESSPNLIITYTSLIIANIELQEYEKAINYANIALTIAEKRPESVSPLKVTDLYNNLGVCYVRLGDMLKAKLYFEKSESIYLNSHLQLNDNYINLLNSLAITYGTLGQIQKSDNYYEKGIVLAVSKYSSVAYNLVYNYALILGNEGKKQKGMSLLNDALSMARNKMGENSHTYFEVLTNYADYLREFKIDNNKSLAYYLQCIDYLNKNPQDLLLKDPIRIGYSLSLREAGEYYKAIEVLQPLLYNDYGQSKDIGPYDNPSNENLKPDKKSLRVLRTKYNILWDMYKHNPDIKILEAASNTSELIVSVIERVRINISEEESRLVLGGRYKDSYFNAIRDLNMLYGQTSASSYLEKAFEYSEKSKVAGLLASTREMKATNMNVPSNISSLEKKLQRDIVLFDARIAEATINNEPDTILINKWKESLLETIRRRDSLVLVFEKQYPGYYSIKYNTNVAGIKDIPEIIGNNGNYINYVLSDTVLYSFVVNRKNLRLLAIHVDSSFFNNIRQFRSLLSEPMASGNARISFQNFQSVGYELYKTLISPIRNYLISDRIVISPDNILSYLPFEALPTSQNQGENILYREVPYLMNDFDISYTYSATFMAESGKRNLSFNLVNNVIAFAPSYPEAINIKDLLMNRQSESGTLPDLPYAKQEAEYVTSLTKGMLYEGTQAKGSVFKSEAGKFDIIHLAMHTFLSDKDPMQSTLIFSPEISSPEDRYLKTYEVYGIPLKAKMVILSSCNTGSGLLYSGEGIMSLARGFIYSGSKSVVMSMWEIEDKSSTEIVKMFYKNLKNGNSKSESLRKARIAYLKKADQLRSHPYFWSALIIYGDDSPLYYPRQLVIVACFLICFFVVAYIIYFRKRKYS